MLKFKSFVVVLFFLGAFSMYGQDKQVKVDLSSPYHTIFTHLYFLQPSSYDSEKASKVIYGQEVLVSEQLAIKIKQILDGKGLKVDVDDLPTNPNYLDTIVGLESRSRYVLFPRQLPDVYLEKINNQWYYSRYTIQNVDRLYQSVYPLGIAFLKNIIPQTGYKQVFGLALWQYWGLLLFVLAGFFFFYVFNKLVFFLLKCIENTLIRFEHVSLNVVLNKLSRPISLLIVFLWLEKYIPVLQFNIDINSFVIKGLEVAEIVLWIYVFLQCVNVIIGYFDVYSAKTDSKLDDQLGSILKNTLKVLVYVFGGMKMLTVFGVDTTTVLAGASIGGLAIALASQDTVKNLIGTVMIFVDKPFHIGDWIEGGGVEGLVEEVGFRSTRIRAVDTSVFTIPNSTLSEIVVNNKGLRQYRRYTTKLGIRYDTPPELIEAFVKGVRKIIEVHPETLTESYHVEFTGFGDFALEILVNTYFLSLDWGVEQSSKHRLHMSILRLANEIGVQFAFPSQTIMIEEFPEKTAKSYKYQTSKDFLSKVFQDIDKNKTDFI